MAETDPKMKDILIALYTQNEQYHNIKERVVWLAGIVYFTFSVFVLRWIPDHKNIWAERQLLTLVTMTFLTLLFIVTFVFIIRQTKEKAGAAVRTDNFFDLFGELDAEVNEPSYRTLIERTDPQEAKEKARFFLQGWSGVLILAAVLIFYFAQVVFLCTGTDNKNQLLYGFGIALGLLHIGWWLTRCLAGKKKNCGLVVRLPVSRRETLKMHFKEKGLNLSDGLRSIIAEYMDKEGLK